MPAGMPPPPPKAAPLAPVAPTQAADPPGGVTGPPSQSPRAPVNPTNAIAGGIVAGATNSMIASNAGFDINGLSLGINGLVEIVKQFSFFDEKSWTRPFVFFMCMLVACYVWRDQQRFDLTHFWDANYFQLTSEAVTKAFTMFGNSLVNYHSLKATGVSPFGPTPPEHRKGANDAGA